MHDMNVDNVECEVVRIVRICIKVLAKINLAIVMKGGSIIEETYKTNQPGSCSRDVDICNKCFGIYTSVYISYEYVLCTWKRT